MAGGPYGQYGPSCLDQGTRAKKSASCTAMAKQGRLDAAVVGKGAPEQTEATFLIKGANADPGRSRFNFEQKLSTAAQLESDVAHRKMANRASLAPALPPFLAAQSPL